MELTRMRTLPEVSENFVVHVPRMLSTSLAHRVESNDKDIEACDRESCGVLCDLRSVSSYDSLSSLSCESASSANGDLESAFNGCSVSSSPRSIFKTYWEKCESLPQRPMTPTEKTYSTRSTSSESLSASDEESSAANSYERVLKRSEGVKSGRRRSIFGMHESARCLLPPRPYQPTPRVRTRAKSAPELEKNKSLPSCLRSTERKPRSSSVSFDAKVSVITFNPPKENWASDGWSKWFY